MKSIRIFKTIIILDEKPKVTAFAEEVEPRNYSTKKLQSQVLQRVLSTTLRRLKTVVMLSENRIGNIVQISW